MRSKTAQAEQPSAALKALLDTVGKITPVDPVWHPVNDCVQVGDRFIRVDDVVKDTVDGMILTIVEWRHTRSIGHLRQIWEYCDDYTVNSIDDAFPEDQRSIDVILSTLARVKIAGLTQDERREAAQRAFTAAVREHFEARCMAALLDTEE